MLVISCVWLCLLVHAVVSGQKRVWAGCCMHTGVRNCMLVCVRVCMQLLVLYRNAIARHTYALPGQAHILDVNPVNPYQG